jgi:hypothetical protein
MKSRKRESCTWLIIRKPVEVYRSIEIRRDCMIIEGGDIFWLRWIETNWPAFQVDKNDEDRAGPGNLNKTISGISA